MSDYIAADQAIEEKPRKISLNLVEFSKIENVECKEIKEDEIDTALELAKDMMSVCSVNGGMALSAPQVDICKQLFVWMINDTDFEIAVNPKFYPEKKKTHTVEGCLSYPEEHYYLERYKRIRAVYYTIDENKKLKKITKNLSGTKAIVFQHECGHLAGKTIAMEGELLKRDTEGNLKKA